MHWIERLELVALFGEELLVRLVLGSELLDAALELFNLLLEVLAVSGLGREPLVESLELFVSDLSGGPEVRLDLLLDATGPLLTGPTLVHIAGVTEVTVAAPPSELLLLSTVVTDSDVNLGSESIEFGHLISPLGRSFAFRKIMITFHKCFVNTF